MKLAKLFLFLYACLSLNSSAFGAEPSPEFKLPTGEESPKLVARTADVKDGYDWGTRRLKIPEIHKLGYQGETVIGAAIDTGCDPNHPDLKGAIMAGRDYTGSPIGWNDTNSHGSHCIGTIAARGDLIGCMPKCKIVVLKALGDNGSGRMDWCAAAIMDAVDKYKVHFISLSLGARTGDDATRKAVQYATSKGVIVIAAAGNDGPAANTVGAPGGYPEAVCVGASNDRDRLADFSSRGTRIGNPFCVAPGTQITSTIPGGRYGEYDGTSMATPHVAGCCGLWLEVKGLKIAPEKRVDAFKEDLRKACSFPNQRDSLRGHGLFDVLKLCGLNDTAPPKPPVPPSPATVTITEADLTPEARAKLRGATFKIEVTIPATGNTSAVSVSDGYSDARRQVEAGNTVYLVVGGSPKPGAYWTPKLSGMADGEYRCWSENGKPVMQPVSALPGNVGGIVAPTAPARQFAPQFRLFDPPLLPALGGNCVGGR